MITLLQKHFVLRLLLLLGSLLCAVPATLSQEAPQRVLRVVGDDNYPPFLFRDQAGRSVGYVADWWALWEQKTGIKVELHATQWAEAQSLIGRGEADVIDNIFRTPQREPFYEFTPPYANVPVDIFSHFTITSINDIKGLRGFQIGAMKGDACIDMLQLQGITNFHLYDSYASLINGALAEDVKLFCMDELPANYYLYQQQAQKIFTKAFQLYEGRFHRAVRKGDIATLRLIEQGTAAISTAEDRVLRKKWLKPPEKEYRIYLRYFMMGTAVLVLFSLTLIFWLRSTRSAVQRQTAKLRESEERYRLMFEHSADAIIICGMDTHIITANKQACRQYGHTLAEFQKLTIADIETPEDAVHIRERITLLERDGQTAFEAVHQHTNGSLLSIDVRAAIIHFDDKLAMMSVCRDITHAKEAEAERQRLQARLVQAQKMEAIGTLAGGIAHDFNNILSAVLGYAEMAKEDSEPGSQVAEKLDRVIEAGTRAAGLVKQILAFSRQVATEPVPLNPEHIIQETVKLLRPSLPSTITIQQQSEGSMPTIIADPTQIHQLVMNLCTNAFHAMEQTGGILTISLKSQELSAQDLQPYANVKPGTFAVLSVSDTGVGIPPEIRDRIFEPYFTTKEVGKGTGMGLAIIHGIATSLGGFVTCESILGQGAVFRIFFPAIELAIAPKIESADVVPTGKEHVLFVDDEEMLADLGKTMLERLGYHVTSCSNGIAALACFREQPDTFDVLVTDQTMPGMTGFDLARQILLIRPDFPIILCTGYSNLIDEKAARQAGIKAFIMKPVTKKELAEALGRAWTPKSPCSPPRSVALQTL